MTSMLKQYFSQLMEEYGDKYKIAHETNNFKGDIVNLISKIIPSEIKKYVKDPNYEIQGKTGVGRWAVVPYIVVLDNRITTTPKQGVYIVYLLNKDTKRLYLTFNQGVASVEQKWSLKEKTLKDKAFEIRESIKNQGYQHEFPNAICNSGNREYDAGCICCKEYTLINIPDDEELVRDLQEFIELYECYYKSTVPGKTEEPKVEIIREHVGETIEKVKNYIETKSFSYPDGLIENLYLCLKSKPFVILAGTSGTGKTRLVRLFAEAISAKYKQVSVRPDWSDSTDLFGYVDLNGNFVEGEILSFVKEAHDNLDKPYILCLDEMNLARVEYYMSDILSVIETRDMIDSRIVTDNLISEKYFKNDTNAKEKYGSLMLPENLYIVGTVNMDETTFQFSKKVLDRANTIEFSYVDLMPNFSATGATKKADVSNDFLKSEYLLLASCGDEKDYVTSVCEKLKEINEELKRNNLHVGYRIRDEIVFYMLNNKKHKLISEDEAFDNELLQKILPRIQGNNESIKEMLCELFKICAGDYEGYQIKDNVVSEKMLEKIKSGNCSYPKSAEKIAFMVRRFEEDGFTSYWL